MRNNLVTAFLITLMYAAITGTMFLIAGTWRLPFFWAVMGSQWITGLIALEFVDPDLISERMHPRGKDQDPLGRFILSALFFATLWIAAADAGRWHISHVPIALQVIAFVTQTLGWIGFYWAMSVNRFFALAVRLQTDRQQQVITSGPYKWVRHPGYGFAAIMFIAQSIALGSWLGEIPMFFLIAHMVYRTLLEEKILTNGLAGYSGYVQKVRYRWLPGIW
jgi:protein-S-isoprenylcysteine O-methyltransferase Ste14